MVTLHCTGSHSGGAYLPDLHFPPFSESPIFSQGCNVETTEFPETTSMPSLLLLISLRILTDKPLRKFLKAMGSMPLFVDQNTEMAPLSLNDFSPAVQTPEISACKFTIVINVLFMSLFYHYLC